MSRRIPTARRLSLSALGTVVLCVVTTSGCKGGSPLGLGKESNDDRSGQDDLIVPPDLRPGVGAQDHVVEGCPDGNYREVLPDQDVDLADLVYKYQAGQGAAFALKALKRRYPFGSSIMEQTKDDELCQEYLQDFGKGVWPDLDWLATAVHECGHMLDLKILERPENNYAFAIDTDLEFMCLGASHFSTDPHKVVTRNVIKDDEYSKSLPACEAGAAAAKDCEVYTSVYLDGDSGVQGFNLLVEEFVQYVNSLAVAYSFQNERPNDKTTGDRDGPLAMMWFIERYLKKTRLEHPDDYAYIMGNTCWRDVVLTTWGRAWLYLGKTDGDKSMEITAGALKPLVEDPELLDEIQALRIKAGCATPNP